jgi:hypothetical protein
LDDGEAVVLDQARALAVREGLLVRVHVRDVDADVLLLPRHALERVAQPHGLGAAA